MVQADGAGNLTIPSMPAQNVTLTRVYELTTKTDLTGANGVILTDIALSGANLTVSGGRYFAEDGKTITVTATLQGKATNVTNAGISSGTRASIEAVNVVNGVDNGNSAAPGIVITTDGGTGTFTYTLTTTNSDEELTITLS